MEGHKRTRGKITFSIKPDGICIEIKDYRSRMRFATIDMSPSQFINAMSQVLNVPCMVTTENLDKIGKKRTSCERTIEVPKNIALLEDRRKFAADVIKRLDEYRDKIIHVIFGSADETFFEKDEKYYVRAVVWKWQ